jgi:hypothetical protein
MAEDPVSTVLRRLVDAADEVDRGTQARHRRDDAMLELSIKFQMPRRAVASYGRVSPARVQQLVEEHIKATEDPSYPSGTQVGGGRAV